MVQENPEHKSQDPADQTGKVMGVVDTREALDEVVKSLEKEGFHEIEVLAGPEGIALLEEVDEFHFSDMEDRVLTRHLSELKEGCLVFAVKTPSKEVDKVTALAESHGARLLVHFSWATVTWMTK